MITIEDRIRRALAETADEIIADQVPPFTFLAGDLARLPGRPTGPRKRILAAAAAATAVAAVAIAAGVLARGQAPQPRTYTWSTSPPSDLARQLHRALVAWSDFPVSRSPRPLVLLVGSDINDPASGFASGAAKEAYLQRAIDFPTHLPSGPARMSGYPLISATQAVTVFKSTAATGPPVSTRLTVRSMRVGTGVFETDRGPRRLTAWLIAFRGVRDPAAVLAVAPASIFAARQYGRSPEVETAWISSNGRTLELRFIGGPGGNGPCSVSYRGYVLATRHAVAVAVSAHSFGAPGTICALPGYLRHVTIRLPEPLGGRVVVDAASGVAVAVSPRATLGS